MDAPRVVVTPPSFCKSPSLRAELSSHFPNTVFNEKDRYLSGYELIEFLKDADAAMIGRDLISAELVRSLPKLKMISKYGVGLDNVDQDALRCANIKFYVTFGTNKRFLIFQICVDFRITFCHCPPNEVFCFFA
jgi:D-3-phosphoglycerate dehydrogenase